MSPTFPPRPENEHACVGPYRLLEPLGAGGMGEVWLAEDPRLSRQVAIKRIRHDRAQGAAFRSRFRREARAVARLSHPGIVQIHDLVEEEDGDSIVFEYVQGSTVAELVQQGPLDLTLTCSLGRQVAQALAAAHGEGLIHRDLKAENVIVTVGEDGSSATKILDFGLVKVLAGADSPIADGTALTADATVLGTFRSMAPEQASGAPLDHRADLFSLGVLLYEMVSGRSPFAGVTAADTVDRLLRRDPEPLTTLRPATPRALASLVERLLEKDPRRRPDSAHEVAAALDRIEGSISTDGFQGLADAPTSVDPAPLSSRASLGVRRRRWPLAVALFLALALLAALALHWGRGPRELVRIAVLPAELAEGALSAEAGDPRMLEVATNVTLALTRTLVSLEGITAVDPRQLGDLRGSSLALGRAVAAREIVSAALFPEGANARLELRRTRVADGAVLWSESLPIPTGSENALLVADAVARQLGQAFSTHPWKAGRPKLEVHSRDYEAFLKVHRRIESGTVAWNRELEQLETIVSTAPDFYEAHLLAADTARNLYGDSGDPAQLRRARYFLGELQRLAPEDFRTRSAEVALLLVAGRRNEQELGAAEAAVAALEKDFPGIAEPLELRSELAEARGNLSSAIDLMKTAVERLGTWRQLYRLAHLEMRASRSQDARRHLQQLLELTPDNLWAKAKLAQQELLYGDAAVAETLFLELTNSELTKTEPHRSDLNNLGLARLLQGELTEARDSFRQALALDPNHLATRLNLADAEADLGNRQEARELYQGILASFEASERQLSSTEAMMRAQCLARLGQSQEAVDIALRALRASSEDAEVAFAGALVFSLAGQTVSALASSREALRLGVSPRWFTLPGFHGLYETPAFQQLLKSPPSAG